jgi:hypothetical protein
MPLLGWLLGLATLGAATYIGLHPQPLRLLLTGAGLLVYGIGTVRDEAWWDELRSGGLLLVWAVFAWTWLVAADIWPDNPMW